MGVKTEGRYQQSTVSMGLKIGEFSVVKILNPLQKNKQTTKKTTKRTNWLITCLSTLFKQNCKQMTKEKLRQMKCVFDVLRHKFGKMGNICIQNKNKNISITSNKLTRMQETYSSAKVSMVDILSLVLSGITPGGS